MSKAKLELGAHLKDLEDLVGSKDLMALAKESKEEVVEAIHLEIFLKNLRNSLVATREEVLEEVNSNPKLREKTFK